MYELSQQSSTWDLAAHMPSLTLVQSMQPLQREEKTSTLYAAEPCRRYSDWRLAGQIQWVVSVSCLQRVELMIKSSAWYTIQRASPGQAECLYMDGTFETCSCHFYQILSIHIVKYGHTFPMVCALLPNKQQSTYNRMLMMLKKAALELELDF